jgi:hypothetical protein
MNMKLHLLLLALIISSSAHAQSDLMHVKFSLTGGWIGCSFTTTFSNGVPGGNYRSYGMNVDFKIDTLVSISNKISKDTSYNYEDFSSGAYYGVSESVSFEIDTTSNVLRNLVAYCDEGEPGFFSASSSIFIDSIPFTEVSSQILITPLECHGSYQTYASYDQVHSGGVAESGFCRDTGWTFDTVSLQVTYGVSSAGTAEKSRSDSFRIESQSGNPYVTFAPADDQRSLIILNLVGQCVTIVVIPSGSETFQIPVSSFPHGLYFALLGNEVTKFVVAQ